MNFAPVLFQTPPTAFRFAVGLSLTLGIFRHPSLAVAAAPRIFPLELQGMIITAPSIASLPIRRLCVQRSMLLIYRAARSPLSFFIPLSLLFFTYIEYIYTYTLASKIIDRKVTFNRIINYSS